MKGNGTQSTRYPRSPVRDLESCPQDVAQLRVIRAWLGAHPIVSYENEVEAAANFEHAMRRRYPSCRVTNDRVDQETATAAPSGEATVR
jgi:hypothetical protein